jgi:PAS domain S-box-containing protein
MAKKSPTVVKQLKQRGGIRIGQPLKDIQGVLTGKPPFIRATNQMRRRRRPLEAAKTEAKSELAERKRAEESLARRVREQAALYQFTDQINRAASLDQVYASALKAIVNVLGCDRASILLFDDSKIMRFVAWRGLSEAYRKAVEGHSPWKAGEKDPSPIGVEQVAAAGFSTELLGPLKREGIQALAFIPLLAGGNLIGKFMTYYNAPHRFTEPELHLALTLAHQIGFAVDRKRAEDVKARLAAIVESSEDAIISKDVNGVILSWNRGAERLFGFSAQEALGQPIMIIVPPERAEEERRILARIRRREPVENFETVRRGKDGTLLDISLTVSAIIDAEGKLLGVSKIARDITRQKRAEQALQESEERYRTLVAQVKDYAIFRMDHQGRPTSWNEGVRRVLGFEEADFIGQDVTRIFTPEDVQACVPLKELRQAAEEGTASNERWMLRADGKRFYASGVTTALWNSAGEHIGYSKVLRDNTALAEAQAKLEAHAVDLERLVASRTKDLQAINEQLEAFVYSIAHDLRTPLRTVTGYSQLLLDEYAVQLQETVKHLLTRIHNSSEFMDKLLLDLLAFGKTARAEIELGPVEVSRAWESAVFQCANEIEQTQATVHACQPLSRVIAHEATLAQSLANLLSNAIKFVAPGVRPKARFWAEQRGGSVRLWLQDNGLGIAQNQQQRVFRVFERLHGSRYAGTGIGLSIVRKGVERMGGSVGLESEPDKGSRFWIELPRATGTAS